MDKLKGLDQKTDTFPRNDTQLCAVLPTSAVLFEIQQALVWLLHE
jgi:hypothetical protein